MKAVGNLNKRLANQMPGQRKVYKYLNTQIQSSFCEEVVD